MRAGPGATPVDYIRVHEGDDFTVQQVSPDHFTSPKGYRVRSSGCTQQHPEYRWRLQHSVLGIGSRCVTNS